MTTLKNDTSEKLSVLFKIFGDQTRIKMIDLLSKKELCVSEIVDLLEMEQSAISHQLKVLRDHNLVRTKQVGKQIYYALSDDHIMKIFEMGLEHIKEENYVEKD